MLYVMRAGRPVNVCATNSLQIAGNNQRRALPSLGRKHIIMPIAATHIAIRNRLAQGALPLCVGLGVYALLLIAGNRLLADPDTYWQITIGRWIFDHRAVPVSDIYSFTMLGKPWISTQWLAQLLYGEAYALAEWPGVVVLTSLPIALTYGILARFLERRVGVIATLVLVSISFAIALPHLLARPHALSLPIMVVWAGVLLSAAERRETPSLWFIVLMTLWANIHGSFVFGLLLVAPFALDALVNAGTPIKKDLALSWAGFGVATLVASCLTPYGWNSLFAAQNILSLGEALSIIREWAPANFSSFGLFEACMMGGFALALVTGVTFPPVRILILLGLLHMALTHVRNADVFALLTPMVLAAPLAARFKNFADAASPALPTPDPRRYAMPAVVAVILTIGIAGVTKYEPNEWISPEAAVSVLKLYGPKRVFNDYDLGGYLIWRGVPTYIDGRTELFGSDFMVEHNAASSLQKPLKFLELLDSQNIDATILRRQTAGSKLLDRMPEWQQVFADDIAVVHIRKPKANASTPQK